MSTIQDSRKTWLATGSLLTVQWKMVSVAKISAAPYLQALAIPCLLFCLWGGRALYSSQLALLWYSFNPLFCERTRGHHVALEPFTGKVLFILFYFFVSLATSQFRLLSHISSLRLSSRYSGQILILRTNDVAHASLPSSH